MDVNLPSCASPTETRLSSLREIAQAMASLSPDRAGLFLLEQALLTTQAKGAVLMTSAEKFRRMVPLLEHLTPETGRPSWNNEFLGACYQVFLGGTPISWDTKTLHQNGFSECCPEGAVALAIPVRLAGRPVALLFIFRCGSQNPFTAEHQDALDILVPFMGTLLENLRMHDDIIQKNSRLSALYEISQRAESLIDLRDVYEALEKVVHSFIDYDAYVLHLLGPDGRTLEARKEPGGGGFPARIILGEGIIGQAALEMKPHLTFTKEFKSVLILPIIVSGKLIGVVTIASQKSYAYRDEDIIGLRIIATQIGSVDQLFKDLVHLRGFTQHILESMNSGVLILDNKGKATFANPEMTKIIAQPLPEGWSPDNPAPGIPSSLGTLMRGMLATNVTIENARIRIENSDPPKILEVNGFPFRDEQGMMLGSAFFIKDITQIVQMEDNMERVARLSALGGLAAGVAHEIRNPLTGIKMIVQLQISELPEADPRREPMEIILREIERLERIVVNLLEFARPMKPKIVSLDLPKVLDDCLLLLQNQIRKVNLSLEKSVAPDLPALQGDPDQLKQVFLNILTNAIQASNHGGQLRVAIGSRPGWIATAIQDSGVGIPADRLKAIFDPFMTTKEDGTGLGLCTAQRIIDEHGGRIDVDSILGRGSTFTVSLPSLPSLPARSEGEPGGTYA